ncbi:MAG: PD-(D/E)XK nuclease family transposase, partial [Magnetococcales bacterium]|nr:PD-(D/E)XK nuclease family transposase [Magnetococcales bacterium]
DKYDRVDMKIRDGKGELILIELQYEREYDYLHWLVYGRARTITEHNNAGDTYSKVPKLVSISTLYFDPGLGNDDIYHGTTSFKGLHTNDELQLTEGLKDLFHRQRVADIFPEFHLLRVNRFDDMARNTLDEWIDFLKTGDMRNEYTARGLTKAKELPDVLNLPEAERQAYERYQDDLHFQASMVESTWGAGKLEGRKERIQIGKVVGIRIGERRRDPDR